MQQRGNQTGSKDVPDVTALTKVVTPNSDLCSEN